MSEAIADNLDRVEFSELKPGDSLVITTGTGDEVFEYRFDVDSLDQSLPAGVLTETQPDGTVSGSMPFSLQGCGRWTTREQNPVQRQTRAFTPYFDGLIVGDYMIVAIQVQTGRDRLIFDRPGQ